VQLPVPVPPLTDGVVALRPPKEGDLAAIEQGITDPEVVRWIGPSEYSARQVLELNRSRWAEGTGATFSICDPKDDCVGHVWVNLDGSGRGEVGYWLLAEARGNGFATRSVGLISRWAFRDLELARLSLLTEASNEQSRRVAERSGFVREGFFAPIRRSQADVSIAWSSRCFPQTRARITPDRTPRCPLRECWSERRSSGAG
jgi:[ribosomal protein S5]-alanine N-acetyltransferase